MREFEKLVEIVAKLRSPQGCPWDREQTHDSLRPGLLEEAYETLEAINEGDDAHLREELGDLLLQAVFHAQIAKERGAFDIDGVAGSINEKLIRRHPHVFAEAEAADSREVLRQWEQIKREEKGEGASLMQGHAAALPALLRAQNIQKKAARVGFDWPDVSGVFAKVEEEILEVRQAIEQGAAAHIEEEIGDLLFAAVNLARHLKVDAETALIAATAKFINRFQSVEKAIAAQGKKIEEASLDEMETAWQQAK